MLRCRNCTATFAFLQCGCRLYQSCAATSEKRQCNIEKLRCRKVALSLPLSCGFQAPTFRVPRLGPADLGTQGILGATLGMALTTWVMWKPYSRSNSRSDSRNWLDARILAQILGIFFSKLGWSLQARILFHKECQAKSFLTPEVWMETPHLVDFILWFVRSFCWLRVKNWQPRSCGFRVDFCWDFVDVCAFVGRFFVDLSPDFADSRRDLAAKLWQDIGGRPNRT